jgi:transcriptional regulator with XRE-family HTH domain
MLDPCLVQRPIQAAFTSVQQRSIEDRFGSRLRLLRLEAGYTQVQLATHLGINRSFISDVERGAKSVSLSYLETFAQGFSLSVGQLLESV